MKVIVTGTTGMVGEGVLHECLQHPSITEAVSVSRRAIGMSHPKLKEVIAKDFYNLSDIEHQFKGYDAVLFCLGTTSVGKKEPVFYKITYELTMHFAETFIRHNNNAVFCYISGAGTDSSEKGRTMWARVKGKTENDLMKMSFKAVYNFRPGIIKPTRGLKNTLGFYKWLGWMIPVIKLIAPKSVCTLKELGLAMINVSLHHYPKNIIEVSDIHALAKSQTSSLE